MLTFAQHSNQGFLNILERHNHLPQFSLYNNGICAAREKTVFPVKNSLNYLVISNNLLLSLSLSHRRTIAYSLKKHSLIRARGQRRNLDKQRTFRSFLCLEIYVRLRRFII